MHILPTLALAAGLLATLACKPAPPRLVTVDGMRFLDPAGRPLLLHGIAIANKSPQQGYTAGIDASDFQAIHSWGMNCVRLAIFWDGLEPTPGHIDTAYLERIARLVAAAKSAGIYVLLDMHQDLYSVKFSDGAPRWATLDDGVPHVGGVTWDDAYFTSPDVQAALDHFWANDPAPDGVPLQRHYATVWRAVAARFRDEPAVLGYDLMNEPFPGRDAPRIMQRALVRLAERMAEKKVPHAPTAEQLAKMEMQPEGRRQVTQWLGDLELYRTMVDAAAPGMQQFDRERLMPFYARLRTAIRSVDPAHILFIESAMSANMGIPSAIEPLTDEHGRRDPQQAYAPHGYDIVVDTVLQDLNDSGRIGLIFARHAELARRHRLPMLVGEWGAYEPTPATVELVRSTVRQFDALGCGDLYWAYGRGFAASPLRPALTRHAAPPPR